MSKELHIEVLSGAQPQPARLHGLPPLVKQGSTRSLDVASSDLYSGFSLGVPSSG